MTTDARIGIHLALDGASKAEAELRRVAKGMQDISSAMSRMGHGGAAALAAQQVIQSVSSMGTAIFEATVAADRLRTSLQFSVGNSAGEMAYLRDMTNRLGLEFRTTAEAYSGFAAAARGTSLEGAGVRNVFESISKAASVAGLSTDQAKGAMLAVQQMMSKGVVSAEEFRQQLGERMPMALQAAANATGTTAAEFSKMLESGKIISEDFLPKFAKALDAMVGDASAAAADRLDASVTRMANAWDKLKETVGKSGVAQAVADGAELATNDLDAFSTAMEAAARNGKGFWGQLNNAAAVGIVRSTFGLVEGAANLTNAAVNGLTGGVFKLNESMSLIPTAAKPAAQQVVELDEKLKGAWNEFNALKEQFAKAPSNIYLKSAINQLAVQINAMQAARNQMASIAGRPTEATGSVPNADRLLLQATAQADAAALRVAQNEGKAYAELMGKMATDKEKFTAAVFEAKAALGSLYTPEIEAKLRAHYIKPTKEAKDKTDEFAKALESVQEKNFGLNTNYTETIAALFKGFEAGKFGKGDTGLESYRAAVEALIKQQPFYRDGLKEIADAEKALASIQKAAAKDHEQLVAVYDKAAQSAALQVEKLEIEAQAATIAAATRVSLAVAIEQVNIARLKEQQLQAMGNEDVVAALQKEIDSREKLIGLIKGKESREAGEKAAKDAAADWERASQQIEQSLTDALMRGFESGKGFAEALRDTVANMFKTLVLRPIVSAVVNPVAGAITGGLGLAGTANAGQAAMGAGSAFGLMGSLGTGLGAGFGMIGSAGVGGWLSASTSLIGTGTAAGAMAGIGALAGPIGAVLAVAQLVKSLDDSGTMHTGGIGGFSATGGTTTGAAAGLRFGVDAKDYTASAEQASAAMAKSIVGILDSTATTFGRQAGYYAATAFADDTSKDGAWGALMLKLGDKVLLDWANNPSANGDGNVPRVFANGEAGAKEYAALVAKDVRDYLLTQTPAWADAMLTALGDAPTMEQLAGTVQNINAAAAAFDAMGRASTAFANLGDEATSALIRQVGGGESAVALLADYYQTFYTQAERTAAMTKQLTEKFKGLGVAMPDSTQAFREMVDTALAAGDTSLAAGLLSVQGAFAQVEAAAKSATDALIKQARANASTQAGAARNASRISLGLAPVADAAPTLTGYAPSPAVASAAAAGGDMAAEIRALRQEVALLRQEARATAGHTAKTAKLLDRAMPDGQSLQTTTVTA